MSAEEFDADRYARHRFACGFHALTECWQHYEDHLTDWEEKHYKERLFELMVTFVSEYINKPSPGMLDADQVAVWLVNAPGDNLLQRPRLNLPLLPKRPVGRPRKRQRQRKKSG